MRFNFGKFFSTTHLAINVGIYMYFLLMLGYCAIMKKHIDEYVNMPWWFIFFMLDIWYNTTIMRSNNDKEKN